MHYQRKGGALAGIALLIVAVVSAQSWASSGPRGGRSQYQGPAGNVVPVGNAYSRRSQSAIKIACRRAVKGAGLNIIANPRAKVVNIGVGLWPIDTLELSRALKRVGFIGTLYATELSQSIPQAHVLSKRITEQYRAEMAAAEGKKPEAVRALRVLFGRDSLPYLLVVDYAQDEGGTVHSVFGHRKGITFFAQGHVWRDPRYVSRFDRVIRDLGGLKQLQALVKRVAARRSHVSANGVIPIDEDVTIQLHPLETLLRRNGIGLRAGATPWAAGLRMVDLAIANHVVEHIPERKRAAFFDGVLRALRPGGELVVKYRIRGGSSERIEVHKRLGRELSLQGYLEAKVLRWPLPKEREGDLIVANR
jgi:hypothetical protein